MSKIDRGISIFQAYSLAKISALNKKSLAIQYAQCGQLQKLEQQVSHELRVANRLSQQILENQLNEIKKRETIKVYKKIAHNAKEVIEIIAAQQNLIFKKFLIEIFAKPTQFMLQDAKENLEEITDLEFCSKWIKNLDECENQVKHIQEQYIKSPYYIYLTSEDAFISQQTELENRDKENQKVQSSIQPFQPEEKKSLEQYKANGCLNSLIIFFIILCVLTLLAPGPEIFFIITLILLIAYKQYHTRSKVKNYPAYCSEIDRKNEDNLRIYNEHVLSVSIDGSNIAQDRLSLNAEHPYMCAKREILAHNPDFESIIHKIEDYIPQMEDTTDEHKENDSTNERDPLFEECAIFFAGTGGTASTASLQRRYSIGYIRAENIMNQLEAAGIVGPARGSRPRNILVCTADLDRIFN